MIIFYRNSRQLIALCRTDLRMILRPYWNLLYIQQNGFDSFYGYANAIIPNFYKPLGRINSNRNSTIGYSS